MMHYIDKIRQLVRGIMKQLAKGLNIATVGKISPNTVTWIGFAAHMPIAILIATGNFYWGAGLLVVFGLFDTLDGELARLQDKASSAGMLLDASTDRMKEVLLYTGVTYYLLSSGEPKSAALTTLACGASLCVSYVKAKGESAVATSDKKPSHSTLNKLFADGLATFEIRMFILVIGLFAGQLTYAILVIAILSTYTAFFRLIKISRYLSS